ncbi:hypothetical protein HWV62_44093, partial [Athelia sp. TMB]
MELQVKDNHFRLVGPLVTEMASSAVKELFEAFPEAKLDIIATTSLHITLLTDTEFQKVDKDRLSDLNLDTTRVYSLGVGGDKDIGHVFAVIIWADGQRLRKQLGLPPKHFYITIALSRSQDPGDTLDRGITSLLLGYPRMPAPQPEVLDHTIFTLQAFGDFETALPYCVELLRVDPESCRGYLRYADVALRLDRYKESMLAYGCAFQQTGEPKVKIYCLKQLAQCSNFSEWGCVFTEDETKKMPDDLLSRMAAPWGTELRTAISNRDLSPILPLLPRDPALFVYSDSQPYFQKLSRFFRWLVPFHFAIMCTPRDEQDISLLASPHLGIRHILTLAEEEPLPKAWFTGSGIRNTFLPIPNHHPPTIEQMDLIMRLFENDTLPLLVHCGEGDSRAGVVAACYLVAYGFRKPSQASNEPVMSTNEAISALRAIKPSSIQAPQHEAFVTKWCSAIWKRQHVVPPLLPEPLHTPMIIEGELSPAADLFILVGLPGSGKSWFSKAVMARHPKGWVHISQDESGSRALSETEIGRASGRVLLDRCNTAVADRKKWLRLAAWSKAPVCVWFDYGRDLCISRAQNRANHPTLPPGGRVRSAVDQMEKAFVKPNLGEGFRAVVTIQSFSASQELARRISPPVNLYKYPRTPHLLDLGAATDDDIVADSPAATSGHVVITEKLDGANMGISLSSDGQILVQNRSHYVNPLTHEQFKKLGSWVEHHTRDLRKILERDEHYLERFILFGEWLS